MNIAEIGIHCTSVASILYTYSRFHRDPFSIFRFSAFCYAVVLLGGVSVVLIGDALFGFKMPINSIRLIFVDCLIGLLIIHAARAGMALVFGNRPAGAVALQSDQRWAMGALAAISVLSITIFAAANGVSFGQTDYEYRYEAARGWGPLIMLMPAFLPFAFYAIFNSKSFLSYVVISLSAMAIGLFTYFVLSGYRQIFIGTVIATCCVAMHRNYIKIWHLIPGLAAFFAFIIGLSFLRYSGDSGAADFDSIGIAAFYYIQGDVFPIDAPMKIREYYDFFGTPPGVDVMFNHILKIVPRALWHDKPLILLDAAGFYTQHVVGYARGVTLSPTMLGEGYLVGGSIAFYVSCLLGSAVLYLLDLFRTRGGRAAFYFVGSCVYGGFFFVREGFSELVLRAFFILAFFLIYACLRYFFQGLPRRRSEVVRHPNHQI
jgi:oligosaccharide repeat unit polymerase